MLPEAFDTLWALSSLQVAVETGMVAALRAGPLDAVRLAKDARVDPTLTVRILDVLVAFGFLSKEGDSFALAERGRAQASRGAELEADLAVTFGQTRALVEQARAGTLAVGWRPRDSEVIRAQAALSYAMTHRMARPMIEAWPEIGGRLAHEGAVLVDIGVGGAGAACAFCEAFPKIRVVGIDPLPAALIEARANVAAHGLGDRITLRAQRGDELTDVDAFDVAFLPAKFQSDAAYEGTLRALFTALRPGGLVMTDAWRDPGDPRVASVSKLRSERWGSGPRTTEAVTTMLERAGFSGIQVGPALGAAVPLLARR
jgi:SAM-dependent methyltransferase